MQKGEHSTVTIGAISAVLLLVGVVASVLVVKGRRKNSTEMPKSGVTTNPEAHLHNLHSTRTQQAKKETMLAAAKSSSRGSQVEDEESSSGLPSEAGMLGGAVASKGDGKKKMIEGSPKVTDEGSPKILKGSSKTSKGSPKMTKGSPKMTKGSPKVDKAGPQNPTSKPAGQTDTPKKPEKPIIEEKQKSEAKTLPPSSKVQTSDLTRAKDLPVRAKKVAEDKEFLEKEFNNILEFVRLNVKKESNVGKLEKHLDHNRYTDIGKEDCLIVS